MYHRCQGIANGLSICQRSTIGAKAGAHAIRGQMFMGRLTAQTNISYDSGTSGYLFFRTAELKLYCGFVSGVMQICIKRWDSRGYSVGGRLPRAGFVGRAGPRSVRGGEGSASQPGKIPARPAERNHHIFSAGNRASEQTVLCQFQQRTVLTNGSRLRAGRAPPPLCRQRNRCSAPLQCARKKDSSSVGRKSGSTFGIRRNAGLPRSRGPEKRPE